MDSVAPAGDLIPEAQDWYVNGKSEGREGWNFKLALQRAGASGHHWSSGQSRPGGRPSCGLESNQPMPTNWSNPIIP